LGPERAGEMALELGLEPAVELVGHSRRDSLAADSDIPVARILAAGCSLRYIHSAPGLVRDTVVAAIDYNQFVEASDNSGTGCTEKVAGHKVAAEAVGAADTHFDVHILQP